MRRALVICLLAGCGRIGFDDTGDGGAPIVGRWLRADTNGESTCAITLTGELWCWGFGAYANLGHGVAMAQPPMRVGVESDWSAVGVGTVVTCGLRAGDTLWCWGTNQFDVIPGTAVDSTVLQPTRIGTGTWRQFAVGDRHVCAIDGSDVLQCWGKGDLAVLGNGTTNLTMPPTPVVAVGTNRWSAVSASQLTTCGIQTDNTLWCWGYNNGGQVGDGSFALRSAPVQIGIGSTWSAISAGSDHTCALEDSGQAWCWGSNYFGELGDGTRSTQAQTTPLLSTLVPPLAAIDVGRAHTCGRTTSGQLSCWGNAERGQFGVVLPLSAQPIAINFVASQLTVGRDVTCLVDPQDHLLCTGGNDFGQAGGERGIVLVPTQTDTRTDWTRMIASNHHACGLRSGNAVECWGVNFFGELANGMPQDSDEPTVAIGTFTTVALGDHSFAGIAADGSLWLAGQYPDLVTKQLAPTRYAAAGSTKAVSIGDQHMCRIQSNDTLACGGLNNRGQLGDGTTINKESVVLGGTWRLIAAAASQTCGVTLANQLQCWGRNDTGQLGTGNTNEANTPQPVTLPGATGPVGVLSLGRDFTCAVTTTGELYCWGAGDRGQLGNGSFGSTTPVRVGSASDWRHIAAGDAHACAIKTDNTLWCWGENDLGQAGPVLGNQTVPLQIGGAQWLDVSAGARFTCAVKGDQTRWCFGNNGDGELGNGLGWRDQFVVIP